jgi:hypothetical protein
MKMVAPPFAGAVRLSAPADELHALLTRFMIALELHPQTTMIYALL